MKDSPVHWVGRRVRSFYRARWYGTVVSTSETAGCVYVRVEQDRCGRPMRKVLTKHLNTGWLEKLPPLRKEPQ